ncbi:MAG: hypothetical protein HYZ85_00160 [Candidatus Omnitrophica bacterium]|nr:hypothetical protein [Candidatus Omnitrophota bacterium]
MRWLLLDEVVEIIKGKKARARSHLSNSAFSPEVLMIEMMAQTAGLLFGAESNFREDLIFAKIESMEFKPPFPYGDELSIYAESSEIRPEGGWLNTSIYCQNDCLGQGRILLMNVGRLLSGHPEPLTFHAGFMDHFKVKEKLHS